MLLAMNVFRYRLAYVGVLDWSSWYRRLVLVVALLTLVTLVRGQMTRYYVDDNRCSVLLPKQPELESGLYIDSSRLFIARSVTQQGGDEFYFTAIVLQVGHDSIYQADDDAVENFLSYYKSTLHVIESKGMKRGNRLLAKTPGSTLQDEWTDHEGNVFTVQASSSGNRIALLYVFGPKAFPNILLQRSFFNSFRFPAG